MPPTLPGHVDTLGAADRVANILLFMPLGAALNLAKKRWHHATALGFLLSVAIELTQFALPGRFPNLLDVLTNTIGAALGTTLPHLLRARPSSKNGALAGLGVVLMLITLAVLAQPSAPPGEITTQIMASSRGKHYDGELHDLRVEGRTVAFDLKLGTPSVDPLPLLEIRAALRRHLLLLSIEGPDLLWRVGDLGSRWGFSGTPQRWRDLWINPPTQTPIHLRVQISPSGTCLSVDQTTRCDQGPTPNRGWARVHALRRPPTWFNPLLDALWTLGWAALLGWWAPNQRWIITITALFVALTAALTMSTALAPPTLWLTLLFVFAVPAARALRHVFGASTPWT